MSAVHFWISNGLVTLAAWLEGRGHPTAHDRVIAVRWRFDRMACRVVLGHPHIVYGSMRDICLDCLSIIDEHPNGRGRTLAAEEERG